LLAANSVIDMSGGAGTLYLAGNLNVSTLGTLTPGTTSTFNYNGTSAQTVRIGVSSITYNHLHLNNTSGSGATLSAAITATNVTGNLRIQTGILDNGTFAITGNAADTFEVVSGATFKLTGTSAMVTGFGTKIFGVTSTVNYAGAAQTVSGENYGHLTTSGSSTKTASSASTVYGNFSIGTGTTFDAGSYNHALKGNFTNDGGFTASTSTMTFNGTTAQAIGGTSTTTFNNLTIANTSAEVSLNTNASVNGILTVNASALLNPAAAIVVGGSGTLTGNGTVRVTRATGSADFTNQYTITNKTLTNLTVEFAGSAAQGVNTNTFGGLKVNNASGVTLGGDVTVNGTLTFASGNLTTNGNKVIISSTGTVSRTSGHVVGNLQKNVATGATSKTFEIGDATNYTPVNVSFANVTTAGDLTVNTTTGDHPNISTSDVNPSKSVNRYWTLTNAGIVFTTYDATFNFVAGDVDAGANTSNFIVRKFSGGSWSTLTVGTRTSTSTQITGTTSFGDFQVGNVLSVAVSNSTFAFGTRPLNTWLSPDSSVLTNDGTEPQTLLGKISIFTASPNTWNLSETANGADTTRAQWSTTSATGPWSDISAYDQNFTIATSVAAGDSVKFFLRIQTPTSTSSFNQYSSTLTVTAQ
ncbi:MAG: hypothetical protein HY707_07700, partial [Ignavibacteriae bacterium]|nr:hypothetical protein [Ignavibacteriota bacterium]